MGLEAMVSCLTGPALCDCRQMAAAAQTPHAPLWPRGSNRSSCSNSSHAQHQDCGETFSAHTAPRAQFGGKLLEGCGSGRTTFSVDNVAWRTLVNVCVFF